jgi:hypothetical protein
MDMKDKILLVGRVEENQSSSVKENVTYIGSVKDNEHFEEDPKVPDGGLKNLINGYSKKKTNIYEVKI